MNIVVLHQKEPALPLTCCFITSINLPLSTSHLTRFPFLVISGKAAFLGHSGPQTHHMGVHSFAVTFIQVKRIR